MEIIKYRFQQHGDERGQLVALEELRDIPFEIKRVYYMYDTVMEYVLMNFKIVQNWFSFVPANQLFAVLIPISAGIGVGLGLIGSILTTRKHLKV